MRAAIAIATPDIPTLRPGGDGAAVALLGNVWEGFALDFIVNQGAVRVSARAEILLATGPYDVSPGIAIDFLDNSSAMGT